MTVYSLYIDFSDFPLTSVENHGHFVIFLHGGNEQSYFKAGWKHLFHSLWRPPRWCPSIDAWSAGVPCLNCGVQRTAATGLGAIPSNQKDAGELNGDLQVPRFKACRMHSDRLSSDEGAIKGAFGVPIFHHIPDIFPIQWGAIRSYLEFPNHLIATNHY